MKKLELNDPETKSADVVSENISALQSIFPDAFREGNVDFDVLKQLLGSAVDDQEEKYGLNWYGKRKARQIALTPSVGTLLPCPEESIDWETSRNLMIEGDNLEVLKLLQKSYARQVKLIYIDPPYNTGNDFVYPDDFRESVKNYLRITQQVDSDGYKITSNPESSGRFHGDWLSMMLPRLKLAHRLLHQKGIIIISIDDKEISNLRILCDEVFGQENFVANIVWEKGRKNDAKLISSGHDYMVVYAKNKASLTESGVKWREAKPGAAEIQMEYLRLKNLHGSDTASIQSSLRDFYKSLPKDHPSKKLSRYGNVDERGVWRDDNMSWPGGGGPTYDVIHPTTGKPCKVPEGGWRYSTLDKMREMVEAGRVMFRPDESEPPIRKTYLVRGDDELDDEDQDESGDSEDVGIQVAGSYFYRSALQASNLMLSMFGSKIFNNPKDHEVLARWINYATNGDKNAIIMDFFAGSGTTGHAVMALNAKDQGSRRYILVQLPEPLNHEDKEQKAGAKFCDKMGKPANIAELTKERLRRSSQAVLEVGTAIDKGFRVFKLAQSNIRAWELVPSDLEGSLLAHAEHIVPGRTEQDILYELLLKLGLDLCVSMETRQIAGKTVHAIGGGALIACLADGLTKDVVESLSAGIVAWWKQLAPAVETRVVFKDSSFADDVAKTNMAAILNQNGILDVRSL
ncbi:site-specific DNA-methyltransferase [Rhizobium sp. BK176]|uniref:site-specific DNA-methyltransferase n=1 Tax=Rhizobium sp. BK176 TaxID=2587071 RepID=UPI00216A3721|nr:site-specific DNA-methyltransferase [Rhizobium sp. BK176]MCS4091364.1 adenine-specific DNA-methyltransferase [Rhizobium sp. BK176]